MSDGNLRIELFVADVERSADFYARILGFTRESSGSAYVPMRRGGIVIGLGPARDLPAQHPISPRDGERNGIGVELVIEVADVDAAYRTAFNAGWPVHGPVEARPWGLRDFRLSDPDGYYVRVTSK